MPLPEKKEICSGSLVRLVSTGEVGVVVCTWYDKLLDATDCYVAFVGNEFPEEDPSVKPYVLRYLVSSLEPIE
jgi:hypothetical protein